MAESVARKIPIKRPTRLLQGKVMIKIDPKRVGKYQEAIKDQCWISFGIDSFINSKGFIFGFWIIEIEIKILN